MTVERRTRRAETPLLAINYQLERVAEEVRARALFLADGDGLLLGAVCSDLDTEAIAAYLPLTRRPSRTPTPLPSSLLDAGPGKELSLRLQPVELAGDQLTLGAVTEQPLTAGERLALDRAAAGVRRILAGC